ERRAPRRRVDAERAAVGEEVEDAAATRTGAGEGAVVALVEEEAGLLPRRHIDVEAEAVLEDGRGGIAPADRLCLHRQPLELPRREVVLEVDEPRRELLLQRLHDERLQPLQSLVRDLNDDDVIVS